MGSIVLHYLTMKLYKVTYPASAYVFAEDAEQAKENSHLGPVGQLAAIECPEPNEYDQ